MPHVEIRCSDDLEIDFHVLFAVIEETILSRDSDSGPCKCRAFPVAVFRHSHILVTVQMLEKPHRDDAFTKNLMRDLEAGIKAHIKQDCFFSLSLDYNNAFYVTNRMTKA